MKPIDNTIATCTVSVLKANSIYGPSKTLINPAEENSEKLDNLVESCPVEDNLQEENSEHNGDQEKETKVDKIRPLHYNVSECPPLHLLLLFGLQQALLCMSAPLSITFVVAEVVCAQKDEVIKVQIISASMLMTGITTILMSTLGVRLPIFQGPSTVYILPLLIITTSSEWQCPNMFEDVVGPDNTTTLLAAVGNDTIVPARDIIVTKIAQLSGSLMLAGVFHFLIGVTGIIGIIIRYIGPVTIVPAITLVGLCLYKVIVKFCKPSWLVAAVTSGSSLIFSIFLAKKKTPIPFWSRAKGCHIFWFPLHQMFSVMISLFIGWGFSAVLTISGFFTDDSTKDEHLARTDAKGDIISRIPFFDVPYPGKMAGFSFSSAAFVGFLISTLMSVLDSVGDYSACAKAVQAPRVPRFAFNRGIAMEGLATIVCGSMGSCHATASFGQNIGAIGITRVASRRVFQVCGMIYILCATVGKFGAIFLTIPLPVLGGIMLVMMGLVIGVVLSFLEAVNLRSIRNLSIIGIGLLLGLVLPYWVTSYPDKINTGVDKLDAFIKILLSNPAFVGGLFACVMDNTVPGTLKERGLLEQMTDMSRDQENHTAEETASMPTEVKLVEGHEVYRLPFIPESFRKSRIAKILPIFDSTSI